MSKNHEEYNLFTRQENFHGPGNEGPLAHKVRPSSFDQFFGQEKLLKRFPFIQDPQGPALIFWGPPGTGKTTLAHLIAQHTGKDLYPFNAVLGGVNELKKTIEKALENKSYFGREAILFVDEIHRFNKSQQDALLPYVEKGEFQFIGATTEHPKTSINRALISRVQLIPLQKLEQKAIEQVIKRALQIKQQSLDHEFIKLLAYYADGDARQALNNLESLLLENTEQLTKEDLLIFLSENSRQYDKSGERHYDVISAYIKSLRGSDPDAALLYLAIMIDGGEDPIFIARRLVIFASEDIGNADPQALTLAVSGLTTVQNIGMPEARITLGQVTCYLAAAIKSNASYRAIDNALEYVRSHPTIEVPTHLRNHHPDKKKYKYPHAYPGHYVQQVYKGEEIPSFYLPSEQGIEAKIKARLRSLKSDQLIQDNQ